MQDTSNDRPEGGVRLLTPSEVAERLRVSAEWVRRQLRTGNMPRLQIGAAYRTTPAIHTGSSRGQPGLTPLRP